MDNKKVFGFIVGLFGVSVLALAVKVIVFPNKAKMVDYLVSMHPTWKREVGLTWDYGFVRNFYHATKKGKDTFEYNGKFYETKTGLSI